MAVDRLARVAAHSAGRRRAGTFEAMAPFEFWPLLLQWSVWSSKDGPPRELLQTLVSRVIEPARRAGDPLAVSLTTESAVSEMESLITEVQAKRRRLAKGPLSVDALASLSRFRR